MAGMTVSIAGDCRRMICHIVMPGLVPGIHALL
jgi:hypothetical protein